MGKEASPVDCSEPLHNNCEEEEEDCKQCQAKKCLTGCAQTFREAMEENRRAKAAKEEQDEVRELRRPAKSFCVAKLSVAGEPEPLEGVYKQVETDNYERYLEYIGAGKMTIGMIMKATRMLTIRLEEDKQWRIRCETTFKAKSMKGFNTTIPGKVVENKYQTEVPEREALQDWDLREVESTLTYLEGTPKIEHGHACCCAVDCPSTPVVEEPKLRVVQTCLPTSKHPGDLILEYMLAADDEDTLLINILKDDQILATAKLRRQKENRKTSMP